MKTARPPAPDQTNSNEAAATICCEPANHAACCEPADKAECCDASPEPTSCGCQ